MMPSRVSVIIPVHNGEKYIVEAIESVLAQTYADVECLVVDDGSTDRTSRLVSGYGERVRYLYQDNAERSVARNNGLKNMTGEYVSFLDADDYLAPEKIADQVAFLTAHPELNAVYSKVRYFRDNGERCFYSVRRATSSGDILAELIYSNFITIHSPLIRTNALQSLKGFNPSLKRYEDWDFFLRLAASGSRFGFIDEVHAFVRMHSGNTVQDRVRMFEAKCIVAEQFVAEYADCLYVRGIDAARIVAFHRADYGRLLILNGRVDEGCRLIAEGCRSAIPHHGMFRLFSLIAGVCGQRPLVWAQALFDHISKYRKEEA
ncbi:MAG: glycosyltransferase [Steroidobacteraceae bacterium]|nr:glycosyltransferase [Deltaproteobacteria bacterium]